MLLDPFLGAPLLARAIAGALPADEAVTGVLVVPEELVERVKADVLERFGLDEIDRVVAGGPDRNAALRAGLEALPADVDYVLVTEGARLLVPNGLADKVVAAARGADAAAPAVTMRDVIVADEGRAAVSLDVRPSLRKVQGPQCYRVTSLKAALVQAPETSTASEVEIVAQSGGTVVLVPGDDDNLLLRDTADTSRAFEVFSRRAIDFAFVYPKDLLPEDPLAKALAADEGADGTQLSGSPVDTRSDAV